MSNQVLHDLIYLIAEISPGAKHGSPAPYGRASFMLLEAGDRQPRSLAGAYRTPCEPQIEPAVGGCEDGSVFRSLLESERRDGVESALREEESIRALD